MTLFDDKEVVLCHLEGHDRPVYAYPGQVFVFGGGNVLYGPHALDELPDCVLWDICGGGVAIPIETPVCGVIEDRD